MACRQKLMIDKITRLCEVSFFVRFQDYDSRQKVASGDYFSDTADHMILAAQKADR